MWSILLLDGFVGLDTISPLMGDVFLGVANLDLTGNKS